MSRSRFSTKVGLFVFMGLLLLGALMINFSKGTALFQKTYRLYLLTPNVGGIKPRATVLMAGVPIGYVEGTRLTTDGRAVTITLRIHKQHLIRNDALFTIEQAGFLGDQYIAVDPKQNAGAVLADESTVKCEPPFNLQEMARSASEVLGKVSLAADKINSAVSNATEVMFNRNTFMDLRSNLLATASNVHESVAFFKGRLPGVMSNINQTFAQVSNLLGSANELVSSNKARVSNAVVSLETASSNIVLFSTNLDRLGSQLSAFVHTNAPQVNAAISNFQVATVEITNILSEVKGDLQQGRGLAGALLKDEQLRLESGRALTNVANMTGEIRTSFSNLNQHGLWWMLWKPKHPKTNITAQPKGAAGGPSRK